MMKAKKWPMSLDLQFFADDHLTTGNQGDPGQETEATETTGGDDKPATFTQSEVDRRISKAVDSALAKAQQRYEQEKQQAIEDAKRDAEAYAKMSAKEREDAEFQKRLEEVEKRERLLNEKQLLSEIESDLKENSLPLSFAEPLLKMGENETIKETISAIKKDFDAAVNERVKEELRQETPGAGGFRSTGGGTPDLAALAQKHRIIK